MVPCAVTRMTAIVCACSARCPSNSIPPMRGILRSVMTIEGPHWVAFSRPSAPSRAVSTRKLQDVTSSANPERSFSSSSTISTFSWLIWLPWLLALIHSNPILPIEVRSGRIPQDTRPVSLRQGPDRAIRRPGKRPGKASHSMSFETGEHGLVAKCDNTLSLRFPFKLLWDRILRSQYKLFFHQVSVTSLGDRQAAQATGNATFGGSYANQVHIDSASKRTPVPFRGCYGRS